MKRKAYPIHSDISEDMWEKIDKIINTGKDKPGSVISVLRKCQEVVSYIPAELIMYISRGLNIPRSEVFGVASFYSLFSLQPKGKHTIKVCMGTACYVKGIKEITNRICNKYKIQEGKTSQDRRFSLEPVRCLGACGLAPVMVVDHEIHGNMQSDKVIDILEDYK